MLYSEINGEGTVSINESVICQIIEETVQSEFAGRVWISSKKGPASSLMTKLGAKDATDDIEMYLENGQVYLKMFVILKFGVSIKNTTAQLISRLKEAIAENAAMPVKEITLIVNGVVSRQIARRNIEIKG